MRRLRIKEDVRMTLGQHLDELRRRLLLSLAGLSVATCIGLIFAQPLIDLLSAPYAYVMADAASKPVLIVTSLSEGLMLYMRVAICGGLVAGAPWIIWQIWMFVAAGLHESEKRLVRRVVPVSAGLFVSGALFFLLVVSYPIIRFFHGFNQWMGVRELISVQSHIDFMISMMLVFGVGFQMPVVVMVLSKVGLVSVSVLNRYRRHVIVGILIFAALVTSPSVVDQVLLAVPMWLLYEFGVLLAWLFERRMARAEIAGRISVEQTGE